MRVGRVLVGAVAAVALVGAAGAGALKVRDNITESQRCEAVKAFLPIVHVSDAARPIAILGDSYTAGDGLDDRKQGWAYSVGTDLAGVGRAGFVNGGYCGNHSYAERLDTVLALNPQTLIIQGGLNDWETPEKVAGAAADLVTRAEGVPRVIVVGPPDVPGRDGEAAVDQALRVAAAYTDTQYVSALDWDLEFLPDRTHLTPAGHAAFAANVADALRP